MSSQPEFTDLPVVTDGWTPKGDAEIKEIVWAATDHDIMLWDRRSSESWLIATLAINRGDAR